MKTLGGILLVVVLLTVAVGIGAYIGGMTLPVDHSTTVAGTVDAPPAKVFAIITNVGDGVS